MASYIALLSAVRPWSRFCFNGPKLRWSRRGCLLLFILFSVSLTLYHLMLFDRIWHPRSPILLDSPSLESEILPAGERKFAIILPVDDSSHDLCKVVSSIIALGYPRPILVNWKRDFHTDTDGIGPSQLAKITGTLSYLEWAMSQDAPERLGDSDLVLMLDGHDIWMQLPPSVLLYRYFKTNQQANKRLIDRYGFNKGLLQTIIISAQKGCVAPRDTISNLYCQDLPESPLPPNVFGFFTDYKIGRWKYMRPKFVNSGSFIGPIGDMRRYFQRVKDKMDRDLDEISSSKDLGGDQGIFAEVFGEQELWRQHISGTKAAVIPSPSELEYHLGLDYTQELFYPTCYSEEDGYFVPIDNPSAIERESSKAGVSPPRIWGIPTDIYREADNPLAKLSDASKKDLTWGEVPLYIDFWTTAIPVAIHHNAWRNGLKNRRITWWDKTWYFPYLRDLLKVQMQANGTIEPLATLDAKNGSLQIWPYGEGGPKASLLFGRNKETKRWQLQPADWNTVCRSNNNATAEAEAEAHWYDEVFRDGKGSF